jgi:repressor of nif and glnA expression
MNKMVMIVKQAIPSRMKELIYWKTTTIGPSLHLFLDKECIITQNIVSLIYNSKELTPDLYITKMHITMTIRND